MLTIQLNSLGLPSVEVTSDLSGEFRGDIVFNYTVSDPNDDPVWTEFEYEYPDGTWNSATVTTADQSA